MEKIKLLLSYQYRNGFNNHWIVPFLHEFFDVVFIENNPQINPTNTIVVSGSIDPIWFKELYDQGYKTIIEHMWNSGPIDTLDRSLLLTNTNWFWYSESLYYISQTHNQYVPNKKYTKLALMPMWAQKQHRDIMFNTLTNLLPKMHYSYVDKGFQLPHDDISNPNRYNYFLPGWYDDTYFSIVCETRIDLEYFFISEKTFKPIAFYHPYIILGQAGILAHLKTLGFETFDNLFDESYDQELDFDSRLLKVVSSIRNYTPQPYDSITEDKLKHNHELFFNQAVIRQRLIDEIINPIMDYFETKQ